MSVPWGEPIAGAPSGGNGTPGRSRLGGSSIDREKVERLKVHLGDSLDRPRDGLNAVGMRWWWWKLGRGSFLRVF